MRDKIFVITSIVIICLFFASCSDSDNIVTSPKRTNVTGKVLGYFFNTGLQGVKVKIEDKSAITDSYGNFFINDIQIPYVVYITDTISKSGSIFTGLSTSECWLPHFRYDIINIPSADINVTLPEGLGNPNNCRVFFTDGKNIQGIGYPGLCSVYLPENKSVTGKVCVLLYTKDNNGVVTSYDKFGYMDNVTISPNGNLNLTFTDSMLSYNPPEAQITGTITGMPPHSSLEFSHFWISMSPRKTDRFFSTSNIFPLQGNVFNFYIPSNLPLDFYPVLQINLSDSSNVGLFKSRLNYLLPKAGATGLNIQIPTTPQITNPPELALVDSNTVFSYQGYSGQEIYHIIIGDSLKSFHIYTNSPTTSLLSILGVGLGTFAPNQRITMTVNTMGGFRYVDEYVNPDFKNIEQYTSEPAVRHYIMKP